MTRARKEKAALSEKTTSKTPDAEILTGLKDTMRARGIDPPDIIIGDGKIHRFPTNARPNDKAGWYVLRIKPVPSASFGDHRTGTEGKWRADSQKEMSAHDAEILRQLERRAAKQYQMECSKEQKAASGRARAIWNKAEEADSHPYLTAKKISAHGVRVSSTGQLIVPVYISGTLQSLQFISADGTKKFMPRGPTKGGYFALGDIESATVVCIAEGFATGASVHEATNLPVVIGFNCKNIIEVAKSVRALRPMSRIVLCADDDFETESNPGLTHAQEAADMINGIVALPKFKGRRKPGETDFNDLAVRRGSAAVEKIIREALAIDSRDSRDVTDVTRVTGKSDAADLETDPRSNVATIQLVSAPETPDPEPPDPFEKPAFAVFQHRFQYLGSRRDPGVYWFSLTKTKVPEPQATRVCSPVYVEAVTRDQNYSNFGRVLRFRDTLGNWRIWTMPMEWLKGKSEDLFGELLSMGLIFPRKHIELFADYLQSSTSTDCKVCATQIGWFEGTFVLPTMVIGPQSERIVFQGNQRQPQEYEQKGSLAQWQSAVAARAIGNPLLELAISISFAGPLLQKCNGESGGVHLFGDSSTGKTTALEVAASTWGGPSHKRSWRATVNGMEAAALLCNDTLLVIDEVSQCHPREVGMIAYGLGNGTGKQRAGRTGNARPVGHFKAAILSSGERSLTAAMKAGGDTALAGQKLRILDLPVNRTFGAWDELGECSNGAEFSDALKRAATEHYGHAGPAFLERLTQDKSDFGKRLSSIKETPGFSPLDATGQEHRAATRFATFALAGELATEYGITPWESGAATRAAAACFATWRHFRGRGTDERQQLISQLIAFIELHSENRFSYADQVLFARNRAGWIFDTQTDGRIFMFTAEGMNEALKGFDLRPALDELEHLGVIPSRNAAGERARNTNINGNHHRLYHVSYPKLVAHQVRE